MKSKRYTGEFKKEAVNRVTVRWPCFSRQLFLIYKWIHTPSVKLPATLAAIQNILRQESVRRGWNEAADYCRT